MKTFEVELLDENPFRVPLPWTGRITIEAESEEEVKELFKDAKERKIESVRGFVLGKITEKEGA